MCDQPGNYPVDDSGNGGNMRITKLFKITFDEPSPHWLCADNLKIALEAYCTNTSFKVKELDREPEYEQEEL
jgi:hypothetical protein